MERANWCPIGFDVMDQAGRPIGLLARHWYWEGTADVQFLGVALSGDTADQRLVPVDGVKAVKKNQAVWVPYSRELVHDAPVHLTAADLSMEQQRVVYLHYDARATTVPPAQMLWVNRLP